VLLLELPSGVDGDTDLGTGGNEGNVGARLLLKDVSSLDTVLDGGAIQLGKVLAGKGNDGRSMLGSKSDIVTGGDLVTVGGAPDHAVGGGTEVGEGLDGLVGGPVLT